MNKENILENLRQRIVDLSNDLCSEELLPGEKEELLKGIKILETEIERLEGK